MAIYLLDWNETAIDQQPTPQQVYAWLAERGFVVEGLPKVYRNGTVQLDCEPDPSSQWPAFSPQPLSPEATLAGYVQELVVAYKELKAQPEHKLTPTDRALLATMALLMYGYGASANG